MLCKIESYMNGQQFKKLYDKLYDPLMKKYHLRKIELDVLYYLDTYRDFNTAKDIVNQKCLSKAHVSKAIENLMAKGFITAKSGQQDRRCVNLSVKKCARPVIEDIYEVYQQLNAIVYHNVSNEEQKQLMQIMDKIITNMNVYLEK